MRGLRGYLLFLNYQNQHQHQFCECRTRMRLHMGAPHEGTWSWRRNVCFQFAFRCPCCLWSRERDVHYNSASPWASYYRTKPKNHNFRLSEIFAAAAMGTDTKLMCEGIHLEPMNKEMASTSKLTRSRIAGVCNSVTNVLIRRDVAPENRGTRCKRTSTRCKCENITRARRAPQDKL